MPAFPVLHKFATLIDFDERTRAPVSAPKRAHELGFLD
jgi:hypothetical protein